MSPEHFLIATLTDARQRIDMGLETATETDTTLLETGFALAAVAYLTDKLMNAGLADSVRDLIAMTGEDGAQLDAYITRRLNELG